MTAYHTCTITMPSGSNSSETMLTRETTVTYGTTLISETVSVCI